MTGSTSRMAFGHFHKSKLKRNTKCSAKCVFSQRLALLFVIVQFVVIVVAFVVIVILTAKKLRRILLTLCAKWNKDKKLCLHFFHFCFGFFATFLAKKKIRITDAAS